GDLRYRRFLDRPAREHDRLPGEIAQGADPAPAADHELGPRDEHGWREGDALAPLDRVGRRAALEIDRPPLHLFEAVLRRGRTILDADVPSDLAADLLDDHLADVERIADRLFFRVEEGERRRILAVAKPDDTSRLDPLERRRGPGLDARAGWLS